MKVFVLSLLALLAVPQNAPVTQSVATGEEPHHKLLLENSYVRVFRVSVPAHEATLLHRHDLPYMTVSLGANDLMNAVAGKPEAEVVQKDRQINYSKGGFAHAIRPLNDTSFNNITVELLLPQGTPTNLCEHIVDGPLGECNSELNPALKSISNIFSSKRAFATDEISVTTFSLTNGIYCETKAADGPELVIASDGSEFKINMPHQAATKLHGGEILWLPTGASAKITSKGTGAVVFIDFKDAGKNAK